MKASKNILSTKYFNLLSIFSEKEIDDLLNLSSCLSFNPSIKIHLLIKITVKENVIVYKKELYHKLFGNTKYDDRKLRNLLSRAYYFLQKFIAFQYFTKNENKYEAIFIASLKEKKIDEVIDNRIRKWGIKLKEATIFDDDYYSENMTYNNIKHTHKLKEISQAKRSFEISNYDYNKALDENFLLKKMKLFIASFNYKSMLNNKDEFTMFKEITSYIESKNDWSKAINIYYKLLMMQYKPEDENFYDNIKQYYSDINIIFEQEEKREIYLLVQNYIIKKINYGKVLFLTELFDLFKIMISNQTIYKDDILSQWSYKNIVTVSLRLNETKWCINFIEAQKNKLDRKQRETTYLLAKSKYFFFINDFNESLELAKKVKVRDVLSHINARIIQTKSFFELDDYDELMHSIESLDKLILRNKNISKLHIKRFKNFSKYLKRIFKTTTKRQFQKLYNKIQQEKAIDNKKWLLKKVESKM